MTTYTIEYTETEELAMQFAASSANDWLQYMAHDRARIAIDEVVSVAVQKFLEVGETIPGSKDEIVLEAFNRGWVKTAIQRQDEFVFQTTGTVNAG